MTHPENDTEAPTAKSSQSRKRQLMHFVIPVGVATALAIVAVFWYGAARNQETTEDAYVEGNIVQVTPQVSGVVTAIGADNTDYIAEGQVLVHLNAVDAQLSLARAQAALARAVRQVRGQFAAASQTKANTALMSVVPLDHLWVSANFKESQIRHIRIGQPVALITDVYGREIEYQGVVVGQDAGTGSAFALLPAQNATGNWIKVVQRVPVRIALDSSQIATHPLRVGLSMKVIVTTTKRDGKAVAEKGHSPQSYKTDIFANELANADEMVNKLIQANL